MRGLRVAIVGGGPGGLMTAFFLQNVANTPYELTLFETTERLGGKIQTPHFVSLPAIYEAGAAEFYDYSPVGHDPLKELIEDLGLMTRPMGGSSIILNNQLLSNLDEVRDRFGEELCESLIRWDRAAKDRMTPREFYHDDQPSDLTVASAGKRFDSYLSERTSPNLRRFVSTLIHSDLATEPEKTSVNYGLQNYLMNDPSYMHLYCIEGGNEQLPAELARRIAGKVLLQNRVKRIAKSQDGRTRLTFESRQVEHSEDFDYVVLAMPNSSLRQIEFVDHELRSSISQHIAHYDHPAHYLRITILFKQPFWRSFFNESYCMLDQFDGCCLYDESSRDPFAKYGILGWLLGGDAAERYSELDDETLIGKALESLPLPLAHGKEYFLEGRVHRWVGAVSALPGGIPSMPLDRRHQPEPHNNPQLFVVGDYLFDSTLNGVLDSADYVSNWIAGLMLEKQK